MALVLKNLRRNVLLFGGLLALSGSFLHLFQEANKLTAIPAAWQSLSLDFLLGNSTSKTTAPTLHELIAIRETDNDTQTTFFEDFDESSSPPFVAFYHVYLGPDGGPRKAMEVTREQIFHLKRSYATTNPFNKTLTVFFNTVGARDNFNSSYMDEICNEGHKVNCVHLRHYDTGFEEVTLRDMHQFCERFPTNQVMYFHNKGSYHPTEHNTRWRKVMMDAIAGEGCLATTPEQCSVCGLMFMPIWGFFFPGNFFDAHCSYVKRLPIPNTKFGEKMNKVATTNHPVKQVKYVADRCSYKVCDRYAFEHWIGMHPELRPCDLAVNQHLYYYFGTRMDRKKYGFPKESEINPSAQPAPRFPLTGPWVNVYDDKMREDFATLHISEMHKELMFLGGSLLRWREVYGDNTWPSEGSWVWDYFPDGRLWREALERNGTMGALEIMTNAEARDALLTSINSTTTL